MDTTRWQILALGKAEPELPGTPGADYVTEWFGELGHFQDTGQGLTALSHTEIRAWADNVGLRLCGYEASWLVAMSRAYVGEISRANNKEVTAPFTA